MKYRIWTLIGIVMLVGGSYWLFNLLSEKAPFLVLPDVFRYQGALFLITIGGFISLLVPRAGKKNKAVSALKQQYPMQPWMWRSDWARSSSYASNKNRLGATIFVLIWVLMVTPIVIAAIPEYRHDFIFLMVFGYGFPAVGAALVLWQLVVWAKYLKAGKIVLNFKQLPARIGERFECNLTIPVRKRNLGYEGELVCFNEHVETTKTSEGYKSRLVRDELWRKVIKPACFNSRSGVRLNMQFQIPDKASPMNSKQDHVIKWYVIVRAISRQGRKKFEREFEVPVVRCLTASDVDTQRSVTQGSAIFSVPDMDEGHSPARSCSDEKVKTSETVEPDQSKVTGVPEDVIYRLKGLGVIFSPDGIDYEDAFWNKTGIQKSALVFITLLLILTAVFATVFYYKVIVAKDFFAIPIGLGVLFGLFMTGIIVFMYKHRFSVLFSPDGIIRNSRLFSWRWQKTFPWSKIRKVMVSASSSVNTNERRVNYNKVVIYGDSYKESLTLSPGFRNEEDAHMLYALINEEVEKRQLPNANMK